MVKSDIREMTGSYEYKKELIIDSKLITKNTPEYLKEFNEFYKEFIKLNELENRSKEEELIRLDKGEKAAIIVARYFDFSKEEVGNKKNDYIAFAREILYENASKPNNDPDSMLYLVKALYGQTNLAYSQTGEHKVINIKAGNEWVDHLEKNTKDHTLKAYALTLRAYEYIVNGKELGMSIEQRLNISEKDLIYATKWDECDYLAYYALGLLYLDSANSKYNLEKSINNFNKVLEFENTKVLLDDYLSKEEKQRAMLNAKKKIELLNNKL